MISIIVYGRNDSHGYQYNKRCSISLNALAHMLTDPDDEICYVDYNTANDLATLPETIHANLTQAAKDRLRIFRVRPDSHTHYAGKTHLNVIESIARNIALYRSNPHNRWILSTNTDIVVTPLTPGDTLSSIAATLEDGFYQLPRYELPEYLWEALFQSPQAAAQNLDHLSKEAASLHLNIATKFSNFMRYDNMGDFQLMLRDDLFKIDGFDESMLLGWTVDANICKRLFLLRGDVQNLERQLACYHCNHARIPSILVKHKKKMDTAAQFVDAVTSPYLEKQRKTWGHPDTHIEEIRLTQPLNYNRYIQALRTTLSDEFNTKCDITIDQADTTQYHPQYIFPYLADHLATLAPDMNLSYIGTNTEFIALIQTFWKQMQYSGAIYMPSIHKNHMLKRAHVIIVDLLDDTHPKHTIKAFQYHLKHVKHPKETKLIGINIDICNRLLKFKKVAAITSRSTVSNLICGYLR